MHAQDDAARELFRRGAEAYGAERYAEALEAFEASYRHREVPVVLFNLAQTLRALDRPAEAIEAYRRYLRTDETLDDERRTAVESVIAELAPSVALVRLEATPEGTALSVDGRALGVAPFAEPVAVDPGARRFEATAEGHVDATRTLQLEAGRPARLRFALRPATPAGTLRLRANVEGATLRVGGDTFSLGTEPLELRLDVGQHDYTVEADGFRDHEGVLDLEADQTRELAITLERRRSLAHQWWLWAGVGGAVLLGVVIALAVALPSRVDPLEGNLPTVEALWAR